MHFKYIILGLALSLIGCTKPEPANTDDIIFLEKFGEINDATLASVKLDFKFNDDKPKILELKDGKKLQNIIRNSTLKGSFLLNEERLEFQTDFAKFFVKGPLAAKLLSNTRYNHQWLQLDTGANDRIVVHSDNLSEQTSVQNADQLEQMLLSEELPRESEEPAEESSTFLQIVRSELKNPKNRVHKEWLSQQTLSSIHLDAPGEILSFKLPLNYITDSISPKEYMQHVEYNHNTTWNLTLNATNGSHLSIELVYKPQSKELDYTINCYSANNAFLHSSQGTIAIPE